MKLLWLTDLHLDRVDQTRLKAFYGVLASQSADAAVITGDISNAHLLPSHLLELGKTFGTRPVYFVLGNHDFYGSSFDDVDRAVTDVCKEQKNLRHLGHGEIIPLANGAALVGHRGWADGRAGWGSRSVIQNRDQEKIGDLCRLSDQGMFDKMAALGKESANYFRDVLPYALKCYEHVWVATHVPPFTWAAFYDGRPCGGHHLPHYTNLSAGSAIRGISGYFHRRSLSVLCGHTHSGAQVTFSEQFRVIAGEARKGWPQVQRVFDVSR